MCFVRFSYVWIPESPPTYVFGKRLLTRFIICLICLLTPLHVVTSFPLDIVSGAWDLLVSVPDRCPLQFPLRHMMVSHDIPQDAVFNKFNQQNVMTSRLSQNTDQHVTSNQPINLCFSS